MKNCVIKQLSLLSSGCVAVFLLSAQAFPATLPARATITGNEVNVRLDSTTGSPVLGTLNSGETVKVLEKKYAWYKITLPSRFGCFVAAEYVSQTQGKKGVVTATSLNIRQKPALESPVLGKIPADETVTILRKHGDFTEINCPEYAHGWVHEKFLSFSDDAFPHPEQQPEAAPGQPVSVSGIAEVTAVPAPEKHSAAVSAPAQQVLPKKGKTEEEKKDTSQKSRIEPLKPEPPAKVKAPSSPPLSRGTLKKITQVRYGCPANYMLENKTGFIFLKADEEKTSAAAYEGQTVKIWGKIKTDSCVYVEARHIIPE